MGTKIRKIKIHPTYGLDFLVTLPDIVDDVDAWVQDMFLTAESWDYVDEDEQARATIQLTTTNNERFPSAFTRTWKTSTNGSMRTSLLSRTGTKSHFVSFTACGLLKQHRHDRIETGEAKGGKYVYD